MKFETQYEQNLKSFASRQQELKRLEANNKSLEASRDNAQCFNFLLSILAAGLAVTVAILFIFPDLRRETKAKSSTEEKIARPSQQEELPYEFQARLVKYMGFGTHGWIDPKDLWIDNENYVWIPKDCACFIEGSVSPGDIQERNLVRIEKDDFEYFKITVPYSEKNKTYLRGILRRSPLSFKYFIDNNYPVSQFVIQAKE